MGTEAQPVASTSKGKESADVLMAGNLSKYSTKVPKATQTQIIAPKASELLDAFKSNIGEFSGNAKKDKQSCANWITKIMSWRCGALIGVFEQLVTVAVQDLLRGDAKDTFKGEMFETLDSLVSALQITFPLVIYQQQLMDLIRSGEAFKGITRYNFGYVTKQYIDDFQELPVGLTMLANAIQKMFLVEWKIINRRTATITVEELTAAVVRLNEMFLVDPEMTPKPFGAMDLLRGDAKDTFKGEMFETLDSLVSALQITFPLVIYQQQLMDLIRSGEAFKGITRYNFGYVTKQYIDDFQELPVGLTMLANAIQKMFLVEWKIINRRTATITVEELTAAVVRLNEMFLVDPEMTPKPFGAMVKSKITSYSTINVQVEQPANKVVKSMPSNPSPTSLNVPKPGKTAHKTAKARALQSEVLNLKAQITALTQADNVPLTSGNASKSGRPAKLGKADLGAAVSLIRLETAQRLQLNVSTNRRPLLRSPWSEEPYQAIRTTNARISIENGPKRWVTLVVVDCKQPWDLLLGNAHLKLLHIQLMTPVMVKQLKRKGRPIPEEGDTVAVDKDSTLENAVPNLPNPELTMPTDQDYAELSETVMITGESPNSEPAPELSTDLEL
ncbi:hypothetical protein COEREDRAFT_9217 [Coemansia reversa NRRL 1564]|uniref:Uncharacterized protein n=1 Tax=Coemansia reversa (strain ATCC 12441 / NRRL 1564) TaxID=763665 RepID=A0A2G5B914_COERN|nr:hypothetical protein COEREDRAFT_9217 [Coemansia reversa NRRL 1564]|eukprot:PIA15505.1 hypothetical protein COEREDRAFT_9217 [Coemansia reversa NRRL 1564]